MKTKHTKGPWRLRSEFSGLLVYSNEIVVAKIQPNAPENSQYGDLYPKESEANAKLIAAAPLLLESLQNLLELADSGYQANVKNKHSEEHLQEDRTLLMKAREAIKAATE